MGRELCSDHGLNIVLSCHVRIITNYTVTFGSLKPILLTKIPVYFTNGQFALYIISSYVAHSL